MCQARCSLLASLGDKIAHMSLVEEEIMQTHKQVSKLGISAGIEKNWALGDK